MSRARLNVFLEPGHVRRLNEIAAVKGVSKSSLVAAALAAFLAPEDSARTESGVLRRLDLVSARCERIDRDVVVLIETFAMFLRHHFAVTAPVPEAHQEAARAQGRVRFEQFVQQLARQLKRDTSFVRDVTT